MSDFVMPEPPYPELSLASPLSDILALGCGRSAELEDGAAKVEFVTPWDVQISWPGALPQEAQSSLVTAHLTVRAQGGAQIGLWQSQAPPLSAGETPPAAPVLESLSPSSVPHDVDATVTLTGTGFDSGAKVMVGPTEIAPSGTPSATSLSVLIPAADISIAGTAQISVKNSDGQTSNSVGLTLT